MCARIVAIAAIASVAHVGVCERADIRLREHLEVLLTEVCMSVGACENLLVIRVHVCELSQ